MFPALKGFRLPVPVDPERPAEKRVDVDLPFALSRLFQMADHIAAIKRAGEAVEDIGYGKVTKFVRDDDFGTTRGTAEFDPVPMGQTWEVSRVTVMGDDRGSGTIWVYSNMETPDNLIMTAEVIGLGEPMAIMATVPIPHILREGEKLLVRFEQTGGGIFRSAACNVFYKSVTKGPMSLDPA